jgi:nicotinate-nucleotide adenylyltransferase
MKLPPFGPGQKIGLFGGSFNPAHNGHLKVALFALKKLQLDWVWWLVSPQNPLKDTKQTGEYSERLHFTTLIAKHPQFIVTDIEHQIHARTTAQTLAAMQLALKQAHFVWIMGADSFRDLDRWKKWTYIVETLPLAVLARPGYSVRALGSQAANRFGKFRVPNEHAGLVAKRKAPAWVFISMPLRKESSTAIRSGVIKAKSKEGLRP